MKTDKVKLETTNSQSKVESNNTKSTLYIQEGISFADFITDQLNYGHLKHTVKQVNKVKETIYKEKTEATNKNDQPEAKKDNIQANNSSLQNVEKTHTLSDKDFTDKYLQIDADKLSQEDLTQIQAIINNNGFAININQINGFNNFSINYNKAGYSYNSSNFTKNLEELISKAYKKNQPIRIDFENDSSVILKIDREGKLSAYFTSSDKAMEMLLKENLYLLRAKLDEEGLPFKELNYQEQQKDNKKRESDEER